MPIAPGVTVADPLLHDFTPDHDASAGFAEAVQSVASVVVQVSVTDWPWLMAVAEAAIVAVGAGAVTVTVTELLTLPPDPVAVTEYFTVPTAVVLGNEAHGLDASTLSRLDDRVTIPMAGDAESLNVAMAATVLCFEAARQRRARPS